MRRITLVLFIALLAALPALAQDNGKEKKRDDRWAVLPALDQNEKKEKKKDDRWKITFNGSVVGPGELSADTNRYNSCYQCSSDSTVYLGNFAQDYLIPNGALPGASIFNPGPTRRSHWEKTNTSTFYRKWTGFNGRVGDEYLLWNRSSISDVREQGNALGLSVDYRVAGQLWLSYSFSLSREMVIERSEYADYLRVDAIRLRNFDSWGRFLPGITEVDTSRHGREKHSTHEHRFSSHVVVAKYDLTSGNDYWSVLPQAGVELLLERQSTTTRSVSRSYFDFARVGTIHQRSSDSVESLTYWGESVQPLAGLTIELYPGGKNGFVSFVVDGRYRFIGQDDWVTKSYGTNYRYFSSDKRFFVPYAYSSRPSEWSILVGGVVRF